MATTDDAEKPKRRPKTTKKVADEQLEDEPSSYPKPDDGPDAPVSAESRLRAEQRRAIKTKTSRKIRVRRAESFPDSVIRRPTQPSLPVCRRVRAAVSAPPKMTTSARTGPSKRRLEMAPSVLAKKVCMSAPQVEPRNSRRAVIELWNARNRTGHERKHHPRHESSPASVLSTYPKESSIGPNCRRCGSLLVGDGSRKPKS